MFVESRAGAIAVLCLSLVVSSSCGENGQAKRLSAKNAPEVSFKRDVFPILERKCLPCHAEDNFNPSELSLDDYDLMKAGGKNGVLWVEGKSSESILVKKLDEKPPFGDRMPLNSKKKIASGTAEYLTETQIDTIAVWIDQGAKNN
jgi:hypothetical protein